MEPVIRHLLPKDYVATTWSGGTTTQVAIGPADAVYADRTFGWRISSATVELEESDFTPLPDYDRFIAPLKGEMRLWHDGGSEITLEPCHIHFFDGGSATYSVGKCTDFNLMLRKGRCTGGVYCVHLGEECQVSLPLAQPVLGAEETVVVYCVHGSGSLSDSSASARFGAGEAVLLKSKNAPMLQSHDRAVFMVAQIFDKG